MTTDIELPTAAPGATGPESGDPFGTGLIAQLANEIFAHARAGRQTPVPPSPPAGLAAAPSSFAPSFPEAPALAIDGRPASRQPADLPGGHAPAAAPGFPGLGPEAAYPFGEPRYRGALAFEHRLATGSAARHPIPPSEPDYYFLSPARATEPRPIRPQAREFGEDRLSHGHSSVPLRAFDIEAIRRDFPALHQTVNGKPLIWLDNAATTQKPQSVIDITSEYYSRHNSNIHRAAHTLAARSTDLFEDARDKLRAFVGAADSREIIFLRGTTEAINLVAQSYGRTHFRPGDEILITHIEHHANIVPWQLVAQATGAVLKVAPVDDHGELIFERFVALLGPKTRFVSVTHVANALGTINPVERIIAAAHAFGVPVLVDAAQSSPHLPIDVRALHADFLVLSGHKVFGPTGIGILYGKAHLLDALPPWQGGGHMIKDVTFAKTTFNHIPEKFEAGTPDIAGAVGLGAAIDYLQRVGLPAIAAYEHDLLVYATEAIRTVPRLRLIGTAAAKASVLSFVIDGHAPDAVARHLDRHGIATRSGHHCAQPALRHFGVETTVRASLAFYNTRQDVDAFIRALQILPRDDR